MYPFSLIKIALILFLLLPFTPSIGQEKVTGTRNQLIQEILSLRRELSNLKAMIEINNIPLSDTITANDTLNFGALYMEHLGYIDDLDIPINTDSLLSIFYLQRSLHHNSHDDFLAIDSLDLVANLPDSVYIKRLAALNSFITLPYNSVVRNQIVYYTQKMPHKIATILGLATYYMPLFEEILDQYELPFELKVMAIIESALNPTAVSRAKARGMWQFMLTTARQYNLVINSYVDERYDPIASAHAAAKYLQDSYIIFNDWALAIASYNCGVGNVNKAIRRANSRAFWDVYPYLPRETRGYVPAFVAALYTLTYYKEHGIVPFKIEMPAHVDTFYVSQRVHFKQIAELTAISVDELRDLNPQYLRDVIPGRPYILRLPYQYSPLFVEKEKEIYAYKEELFFNPVLMAQITSPSARAQLVHTVKTGENLGTISRKYGVKVSDLQYWNNLKGTVIRAGQKLAVYSEQPPARTATATATQTATTKTPASTTKPTSPTSTAANSNSQNTTYQWHTIKEGENAWSIAQSYGVSLNNLLELNGLTVNSKIIAGKKLKIRVL
jgi:membrane-bound lytic murein transglycosylase D